MNLDAVRCDTNLKIVFSDDRIYAHRLDAVSDYNWQRDQTISERNLLDERLVFVF